MNESEFVLYQESDWNVVPFFLLLIVSRCNAMLGMTIRPLDGEAVIETSKIETLRVRKGRSLERRFCFLHPDCGCIKEGNFDRLVQVERRMIDVEWTLWVKGLAPGGNITAKVTLTKDQYQATLILTSTPRDDAHAYKVKLFFSKKNSSDMIQVAVK